jgi:hypothetical protein
MVILVSELANIAVGWRWKWLWVQWREQGAPVVEPWQARAQVVVLWLTMVGTHHL